MEVCRDRGGEELSPWCANREGRWAVVLLYVLFEDDAERK
jgi:hypothetical protein